MYLSITALLLAVVVGTAAPVDVAVGADAHLTTAHPSDSLTPPPFALGADLATAATPRHNHTLTHLAAPSPAVPAATLTGGSPEEDAFLWEATLGGTAELLRNYHNDSVYLGAVGDFRAQTFTTEHFLHLCERACAAAVASVRA